MNDQITYILPLLEDSRLFQKSPVFRTSTSRIQLEYEKLKIKDTCFAEEALEDMPNLLSSLGVSNFNSSALKAMYLSRVLDKKTLTDTLVLGKKLGVANIGTLLEESSTLFLYNDIIGCSMISLGGGINQSGQIDGVWLIGFTIIKGVIVAIDFSKENTEILMNGEIDDQEKLEENSEIVVCWFKDRAWQRPKYKDKTVMFLQSSIDEC